MYRYRTFQAVRVDIKSMKMEEDGDVKKEDITEMELCAPGKLRPEVAEKHNNNYVVPVRRYHLLKIMDPDPYWIRCRCVAGSGSAFRIARL